ncbi:MAG: hypothetical protein ACYCTF_14220 [Acidiferrobacter sp.]
MSGPLPETDPQDATRIPAGASELNARQWQALARMAERYATLEEASDGPLGAIASETVRKASGLWRDHDLARLAREILEAAEALRDAGVFAAIRDGARPAKAALGRAVDAETLKGMGAEILALRDGWRTVQRLIARLEAIEKWIEGPAAGVLTETWVRWLDATRDTDVTGLGHELLRILEGLSHTGALARLADDLPYLVDTVAQLARMAPALLEAAGPVLAQTRADLAFAHALADKGRGLADVWKGPTGEALSRAATEFSLWATEHDIAGLAQDMTALLAAFRDAGLFPAAREAGLALAGLASTWQGVQAAARADGQNDSPGGAKGLYRLLMDPRVQDGLRQGALLLWGVTLSTRSSG